MRRKRRLATFEAIVQAAARITPVQPALDQVARKRAFDEHASHGASKWNLVVHIPAGARHGRFPLARRGAGGAGIILIGATVAVGPIAGPVEQDKLRIEGLQHYFGGILVLARLVLPFARLQGALEIDLRALLQIFLSDPAQAFVEDRNAMPFDLFTRFSSAFVGPFLRRRHVQVGNRPTVPRVADFRILAEIGDEDHLVHAAHVTSCCALSTARQGSSHWSPWPCHCHWGACTFAARRFGSPRAGRQTQHASEKTSLCCAFAARSRAGRQTQPISETKTPTPLCSTFAAKRPGSPWAGRKTQPIPRFLENGPSKSTRTSPATPCRR